MPREPDPFYDVRDRFPWLTPIEIAEQCYELARELRRKGVQRTPEQRLEIALNVAAILTRVAERITEAHTPDHGHLRRFVRATPE